MGRMGNTPHRPTGRLTTIGTTGFAIAVALMFLAGASGSAVSRGTVDRIGAETNLLETSEVMPAFLNGSAVSISYEQGYYVGSTNGTNSSYGSEPLTNVAALGATPTSFPAPQRTIQDLWGLLPYFGPANNPADPAYHPAKYGIQTMCAPATVTICYGHPATVFLPGVGIVPLPGHDHLLNSSAGNKVVWWEVYVILVTNQSYWPNLAGTHGITSFAAVAAAQLAGAASGPIPTNLFSEFAVLTGGHSAGPSAESPALRAQESMPVFLNGTATTQGYEGAFWTGSSVSFRSTYGMEPIMAAPEVGSAAYFSPTNGGTIGDVTFLIPWFGPSTAPYDPAFHPANYSIQLGCAPATVAVCFDHPETLHIPGWGTLPMPGLDHLVGTNASHANLWWRVTVVLVLNQSNWPDLAGTHGITSMAALEAAQDVGGASRTLPTNVFVQFAMT